MRIVWDALRTLHTTAGCLLVYSEHRNNNNGHILGSKAEWFADWVDRSILKKKSFLLCFCGIYESYRALGPKSSKILSQKLTNSFPTPYIVDSLNLVWFLFVFKLSFCYPFMSMWHSKSTHSFSMQNCRLWPLLPGCHLCSSSLLHRSTSGWKPFCIGKADSFPCDDLAEENGSLVVWWVHIWFWE